MIPAPLPDLRGTFKRAQYCCRPSLLALRAYSTLSMKKFSVFIR
jgi:hypothetical protein